MSLPFTKELFTRLTLCPLCNLSFDNFSYFPYRFEGRILVKNESGPVARFTERLIT